MPTKKKPVRRAVKRHRNPSSACLPKRPANSKGRGAFNIHEGREITYRGSKYRIIGCGTGSVSRKSIGVQSEGTYALLNEKTNRVIYVAKRVVRDIAYHRGEVGRPSAKGPRTAKRRKSARAKSGRNRKGQFVKKGR